MPDYLVNRSAQSNGDHEVHRAPRSECGSLGYPLPKKQVDLGWHSDCDSAVRDARSRGYRANGCAYCSFPCHTR